MARARRPVEEAKGARRESVESACDLERTELKAFLDEEIGRLPEKYRRPVVLCYLEGRSHEEAARRLRCSTGSVRGRLDRARRKLQDRLVRRGIAPAAGLAALAAGGEVASAAVPAQLMGATVATLGRAATATIVSATAPAALELADAVFRGMGLAKIRAAALLVVGFLALGALPLVASLERAAAPVPSPRRAAATDDEGITLRGRVLDREGRPIAGARVAVGSDLRGKESVPEAATDADGRFALTRVPAGLAVLTVQARGHEPDLKTLTAGPGSPPVEFRLGPGHAIAGRIVDVHKKPIAGAPIAADEWRGHHSLRWKTRTDAEGRFRWDDVPPDRFLLDLGQLGFSGKRLWTITPDAPEVTMDMRRALHVRGRVTDAETGRPITAFTLVPGHTWDDGRNAWWEQDRAKEVKGLSYDVLLSTSAGLQVIRIEAEGYLPAISRAMRDDEEDPVVVHFALKRGVGISSVVRLPDGSPLAGASVMLATPERPVYLNNGRPSQGAIANQWVVKTLRRRPVRPGAAGTAVHDRRSPRPRIRPAAGRRRVRGRARCWRSGPGAASRAPCAWARGRGPARISRSIASSAPSATTAGRASTGAASRPPMPRVDSRSTGSCRARSGFPGRSGGRTRVSGPPARVHRPRWTLRRGRRRG